MTYGLNGISDLIYFQGVKTGSELYRPVNGIYRKNDMIRIKIPCGTGYQEAEFPDNVKMELIDPPKRRF